MKLTGQHVAILGAGRSGRAAAELCLKLGAQVTVYDTNAIGGEWPTGISLQEKASPESAASENFDLVVISPGIETQGAFAQAFARRSAEFMGEMELAYQNYEGLVVAITGTNGKTTTTELISAFLNEGGISCVPCGNHGRPLSDVVLDPDCPAAVALEASSFQLETIDTFAPKVAVWLNFAPDHMDRYRDLEEYRAAKRRIFENMTGEDVVVARSQEDLGSLKARVVRFMSEWDEENENEYTLRNGQIYHQEEPLVCLDDTNLRGLHNAENIMAAAGAANAAGVPVEAIRKALENFVPPPHRCELIRTLDGVEYLNDSKATNLHALESALRALTRPIVLIAGGKEKGLDYTPLAPLLRERTLATVTFGEIGEKLGELFRAEVETETVETLAEAVEAARRLAPAGSTVLFSPGTSSFDQFSSYVERGEAFRKYVNNLK
ncbi:UDP-N-acetylmuramoyl-L-alanine--D-glutamate ligase [Roseibacillus ishigakijimensis]|uniref:UDP-N-acetylmuramoylalanine--D-glutamate ligase n=1 Tax=Roseibacillus ishigakijimensis TaxID=454146 RepID=A0A934RQW6_9BACT|nr:UDP-N-acetylmuramoyl-L-alanine--D-glutamate ligase [Roseibacillus ishigakijimensis]MBK1835300.1 UDP-N-acetylmuramoyl-L-alanine--D-glutamate ligase [Roseibacillus ishigakijimensis]